MKWIAPKRAIILGLILLTGFIGWRWQVSKNKAKETIKTAAVTRKDVVAQIGASGKIVAAKMATLNFPISGKLAFVNVIAGDKVNAYQTMAGMDVADLDTSVTKAWYSYLAYDAAAKLAEDQVKDHASDETFAQKNTRVAAQTARDTAYDAWKLALRAKQNSYLVAPFAGMVTNVTVSSAGDTIGVTDGITVVDPQSLRFRAEIDETDIGKIFVGQEVVVRLDAFATEKMPGRVERIAYSSSFSDSGSTVYVVDVKLTDDNVSKLRLGLNGDVTIVLERAINALSLPAETITNDEVIMAEGSKKQVVTGVVGDMDIEIKSGLNEGELVRL